MDEHTQLAMALSMSMMDGREQPTTAIDVDLPAEVPAPKPKKRGRKKKKKDEDLDEQTQIAMAMSASLADKTKQKDKDLGKNEERPGKKPRARAKGKLKKIHQEFPVLLMRKEHERQKIFEERINALLESSRSEDFIISDHVFQPSTIMTKYLDPDSRSLTENYPGNIKIKSGLQLWNATGADLSKKETGMSPFYVKQLQPTIVPLTPKNCTSPTSHQVSSKTPTKTPCKQSPKSAATPKETSAEETMSITQSLGMTVQCLAELAEEGLQDSMSLSSDKCGFIPQEAAQRVDSPETQLNDDQLTLLEELSSLVNSSTMSDAVIHIDDGSKLHVHSFMIQLRCPVLATLLAKSLGRNSTTLPSIIVSDMSYEAMENALSYIYAASVNITNSTAAEINRFAERFEMTELASHCKPYLQDVGDSQAARKGSELDIVDKDLNQLIDSLWEDEEEEKEKSRDAGRTSDDEMNDPLDDDEIKEIVSSQRSRNRIDTSEDDHDGELAMEPNYPWVSSPKKMENGRDEMRDQDSEEEAFSKIMLTQGCTRSNTGSHCSRGNTSDDNEDWSMAMDDEVVLHDEPTVKYVTPSAKRTTDERKGMIGEKLNNGVRPNNSDSRCTEDIIHVDKTPNGKCFSRRKDSSSSRNETITDEPHHSTFEESYHSFLDQTLVPDTNANAASMTDHHKQRKTSPETSNISSGYSKDVEGCKRLTNFHERLLDDKVDRSDSPDDEVLLLRSDSAQSESEVQSKNLRKSQLSMRRTGTQAESSTRLNSKGIDCSINNTGQRGLGSSKRKKLLIQQYSTQADSDDSQSPPDLTASCYGDEVQVVGTEGKKLAEIIDKLHHTPSTVPKKLSKTLNCNKYTEHKRSASQSSSDSVLKNRLDSLDGSLSEDILSPSPPPSPRFTRTSQIPRLEKMVEDRRSLISRVQWDHSRSLNESATVRVQSLEDEVDPYELSPSSSTSSGNRSKHLSSSKRKKQKRVKQETPQCGNANGLSSPSHESSSSSKDTKRRWSSLKINHDLPSPRSGDAIHCKAEPEILHDLSPSPTSPAEPHRISPSPPLITSPASTGPKASPVMSMSPDVSYRDPPYSAMQDMDDAPEERFAFDMEEGCGYDDFSVEVDHPNLDDDPDAGISHVEQKVVEDGEDFNRNDEMSEHSVTGNHQNECFEDENEIDLTNEEEEEDRPVDNIDHHSQAFRISSGGGGGYPMDVHSRETDQGDGFNSLGTPQVNHSQSGLVGGGPIEGSRAHHPKLSQSLQTTPRTSQSTAVAVLKTPSVSRLIQDEYLPAAPITPKPNFESMMTPELKKELKRYGVKPLGKKKSKLLLSEIFSYLHQVMPEDESDGDTSSTSKTKPEPEPTKGRSRKGKTAKQKPATKRAQSQKKVKEESSSDERPAKETSNNRETKGTTKKPTKPRKRKKAEWDLDETPTKRVKTESPVEERNQEAPRTGVGMEDSAGLDELVSSQGSRSSSFDSNKSDFGESIYYENLEDDDDIMATQQVQDMSTEVKRYITRNKELHQKILHYEVLNLEEFYKELKEAKVPCSKVKLMEFLDQRCITFRHKEGGRQRKPKNAKTNTKTKR